MSYIMALDAGTTSNRCILFNEKGEMCSVAPVSYTHLRAHETDSYLVCRLLLEKKKNTKNKNERVS